MVHQGLDGARRFLDRVWRLIRQRRWHVDPKIVDEQTENLEKVYHQTVKKVTEDYENLHFNIAISQLMVFVNEVYKQKMFPKEYIEGFVKLFRPITPHIGEELWESLGHDDTITYEPWPTYDESKFVEDEVEIVIQVMGKVRSKMTVPRDISKEELEEKALADEKVKKWIDGKTIRKIIVVPGKLVNIVAN